MIGDGSFQLTAQEVAQMIRQKLPIIIFLVNNHGYTIEVEIHDGRYNNIKNWDYAGLIKVFNAEDGAAKGLPRYHRREPGPGDRGSSGKPAIDRR
ncbi:MAG UNVERIFIED_CONTAM: thiamine pyrophosphate-dependent enzyme [Microcystis novacekii LVE1205-3]|jgi:indolepyruvate decarboxylase